MYVYSLIQFTLSPYMPKFIYVILASLAMVCVWCMLMICNYYCHESLYTYAQLTCTSS